MESIKFKSNRKDPESGIFEKPHKIVKKTVFVNGKPMKFPVKVYDPPRDNAKCPLEAYPTTSVLEGWLHQKRKPGV